MNDAVEAKKAIFDAINVWGIAEGATPQRINFIERVINGVLATDLTITRVDIEDGKIVIHTGDGEAQRDNPLKA